MGGYLHGLKGSFGLLIQAGRDGGSRDTRDECLMELADAVELLSTFVIFTYLLLLRFDLFSCRIMPSPVPWS